MLLSAKKKQNRFSDESALLQIFPCLISGRFSSFVFALYWLRSSSYHVALGWWLRQITFTHTHTCASPKCPSDKLFRYRHTRRRLRQQKTECENVQNANMAAVAAAAADKLFLGYLRSPEKTTVSSKEKGRWVWNWSQIRTRTLLYSTHNTHSRASHEGKRVFFRIKKKTKCNPPKYIQQRRRRREKKGKKKSPTTKFAKISQSAQEEDQPIRVYGAEPDSSLSRSIRTRESSSRKIFKVESWPTAVNKKLHHPYFCAAADRNSKSSLFSSSSLFSTLCFHSPAALLLPGTVEPEFRMNVCTTDAVVSCTTFVYGFL